MKIIPLNRGLVALVDDEDYDSLTQFKWYASETISTGFFYAQRTDKERGSMGLSRHIMGCPDGLMVDHKNGVTLDCRRANLRVCTAAQNMQNRAVSKNNKLGYKGVHRMPGCKSRPFIANIGFKRKSIYLGYFADAESAARAYDAAAKELFGEFARLNFPSELLSTNP